MKKMSATGTRMQGCCGMKCDPSQKSPPQSLYEILVSRKSQV